MKCLSIEPEEDIHVWPYSCPERHLLSAVLLRAWADLDSVNKFIRNDAYYWLDLRETADWSFVWICEMLGYPPKKVKKIMLAKPFYEVVQGVQQERYGKDKNKRLWYFL